MAIQVKRRGGTANRWYGGGSASFRSWKGSDKLRLDCKISGNKGGTTEIECLIDGDEFVKIALQMVAVNKEAAIRAFGKALQFHQEPWTELDAIRLREYDEMFPPQP